MIETARAAWAARNSREQMLLLLLGAMITILALWYGIGAPLRAIAEDADSRLHQAARAWQAIRSLETAMPPESGIDAVLAGANEAGLAVTSHETDLPGQIRMAATASDGATLFQALNTLHTRFGLAVLNMSVARNAEGALDVELLLGGPSS